MPEASVLLLSDYAGANGAATGGAGHVVIDSYHALAARKVRVELVTGFGDPPVVADSLGGSDLRDRSGSGAARAIWNGEARSRLRPVLARHDPATTIVILHQWTRYLSPGAIAMLRPYRLMVYLHDHFWACPNGAYYHFPDAQPCDRQPLGPRCVTTQCDRTGATAKLGRVARQIALATVRLGTARRRLLLHLSQRSRAVIAPLLRGEHHAIVHNPLTIPVAEPDREMHPACDIAYVGRLEPEKGVGGLLDAVRANGWTALIVGEGSLAAAAAATPGVTWRPWQPRQEMAAAMRRCRLVVLPSLWPETWGLVVPEAMAAGVPVLVSQRAGAAGLVERFGGGMLYDPAAPAALSTALARMLALPAPPIGSEWSALRHMLSPERHAQRIVTLARHYWGVEIAPGISALPPRTPAIV